MLAYLVVLGVALNVDVVVRNRSGGSVRIMTHEDAAGSPSRLLHVCARYDALDCTVVAIRR
jgi:hypothetical protein